ncbi:hypothetical protein BRD17_01735 [Halobacteriales archaeon SW_7_68_16]|nr:MAG: hypothetical protein BRD17_01735 [Halobacteriales archaeon SW_7_68_16]
MTERDGSIAPLERPNGRSSYRTHRTWFEGGARLSSRTYGRLSNDFRGPDIDRIVGFLREPP